jgi:LSD1 subclass zinc finger protein
LRICKEKIKVKLSLAICSENKFVSDYAHGWGRNNAIEIVNNIFLYLTIKMCLIYSENIFVNNYAHGWRGNNAIEITNNIFLYLTIKNVFVEVVNVTLGSPQREYACRTLLHVLRGSTSMETSTVHVITLRY